MNLAPPTPEQLRLLQKLNNEDLSTRDRDLEAIKQWLKQEPHLPDAYDERALLNFLRWGKFSLEKTKKRLDMYFSVKSAFPEFFAERDVTRPELRRLYTIWSLAVLPGLTPQARRVTVAHYKGLDFQAEDTVSFAKIVLMMGAIRVHVEHGVHDIYVADASSVQLKNVPNVSAVAVRRFLVSALEAFPVRIKEFHVVNASPVVALVIKWVARFIKDKIVRRITIHDTLESLHECVPKEFLPEEVGGTAGRMDDFARQWAKTLEEHVDWFREDGELKADETKRVMRDVGCGGGFGLNGSFRQLTID